MPYDIGAEPDVETLPTATVTGNSSGASASSGLGGDGLIGGAINAIGSIVAGQAMRNSQVSQQDKLDAVQLKYNEQQMDYGQQLQKDMWNYTNYPNQVAQLEAAGLNPALLYGKGGGGGATTGSGTSGGISGASANTDIPNFMGMALETAADVKLKNAQAENIDADTANKPKQGQNIEANTQNTIANTGNTKVDTTLKQAVTQGQDIMNNINAQSTDAQIQAKTLQATDLLAKTTSDMVQAGIDQSTVDTKIQQIKTNLISTLLGNKLTTAQTTNTQQNTKLQGAQTTNTKNLGASITQDRQAQTVQMNEAASRMMQGWEGLDLQAKQNAIQKNYTEGQLSNQQMANYIKLIDGIIGWGGIGGKNK